MKKKISNWMAWYKKHKKKWNEYRHNRYMKQTEQEKRLRVFIRSLIDHEEAKLIKKIEQFEKRRAKIIKKYWTFKKRYSKALPYKK